MIPVPARGDTFYIKLRVCSLVHFRGVGEGFDSLYLYRPAQSYIQEYEGFSTFMYLIASISLIHYDFP